MGSGSGYHELYNPNRLTDREWRVLAIGLVAGTLGGMYLTLFWLASGFAL